MKNIVDFTSKIKEKFTMRKDIAPVESSSTASRAYSAGDKFYYGNLLQKAITDIAQGAAFVGGTNFENADPVTTTIQNLSNQVNYNTENGVFNELPSSNVILGTKTVGNVTFTRNNDGTISATGTAGGEVWVKYNDGIKLALTSNKKFVGAPSGSSASTWFIDVEMTDGTEYKDYGEGVTLPSGKIIENVYLVVKTSQNPNDAVYKPMLVDASLFPNTTYDDYVPFAASNIELTQKVTGLIDNTTQLSCVNIMPLDLETIKSLNTGGSWSNNVYTVAGISFTVEDDGTVKANGTATGYAEMQYYYKAVPSIVPSNSNKYKLTGCPAGGSSKTYQMFARSNSTQVRSDYGDGVILDIANVVAVAINVKSGQTVSNLVFKPMISLTSMNLNYNDYVPYAKTNRELTEDNETLLDFYNNNKPIDAGDTLSSSRCAGYGIADANKDVEFFFPLPRKVKSPRVCTFVSGTLDKCRGHAQNITDATLVNVVVQRDNVLCIKLHSSSFTPFAVYVVIYEQLNVTVNS